MKPDCENCLRLEQQLSAANAELSRMRALAPRCAKAIKRIDDVIETLDDASSGVLGEAKAKE
jgi:hypothetical protein